MPVADIIRLGLAPTLTPQQIADMALMEDREARLAKARSDAIAEANHLAERDALCEEMKR